MPAGSAIWSGYIAFGLISIPARLHPATEPNPVPLRMIHTEDLSRIRVKKICEIDGQEVHAVDISRGYETPAGIVPLTDDDLDALPLPTARTIELVAFVPAERITPLHIGRATYYIGTDTTPAAARPYHLLLTALRRRERVAIVKFAVRGDRERLGMLRPLDDVLALHALRWTDEIRAAPDHQGDTDEADVDEEELRTALELVDSLSADSLDSIPHLHDDYRQALKDLVEAKASGREPAADTASGPAHDARVVDLMAALNESVEKARARRGESVDEQADEATVHPLPPRTAKKATRKDTARKKAPTKSDAPTRKSSTRKKPGA